MKKNILKRFWSKPAMSLLVACIYLVSFTYTSGVHALQGEDDGIAPVSAEHEYWDGTDKYTSLNSVLADLGGVDENGFFHITEACQLHAVIKYNGGGKKYKLDNDLYLNSGYESYASWGSKAPANVWDFTGHSSNVPKYKFSGTIDGGGHTIYGLYSGSGYYAGLIGGVNGETVIKDLNVWYSYIRGSKYGGVIIGGNWYEAGINANISFSGCSVRHAMVYNVWNNGATGGFMGLTTLPTTFTNCAVSDVQFTSGANSGDSNIVGGIGAFLGGQYSGATANVSDFNKWQGQRVQVIDSYAVNIGITDKAGKKTSAYVCGVFQEGAGSNWCFSITAKNVYTSSTDISSNSAGTVRLLVSADSLTAVSPSSADYPIKTVSAESIKGDAAKNVMNKLDWCKWNTVANDYPTPQGKHNLVHTPSVPATCVSSGTAEYWTCNECKKMFSDAQGANVITSVGSIEAIAHKNARHLEAADATCDKDGNIECWYCPDCKKYSVNEQFTAICEASQVKIAKTEHKNGKLHYTAVDVSCEEDGHIEYWHCADCDGYFTDEACTNRTSKDGVVTGRATGHINTVFRQAVAAGDTCLDSGTVAHWECNDCGKRFEDEACKKELYTIDAPSDKHKAQQVSGVLPTCYKSGITQHFKCIYCDKLFTDEACTNQVTISMLTIPATEHSTAQFKPQTPAGCITVGLEEHWYCAACDGYFTDATLSEQSKVSYSDIIIAANGHQVDADAQMEYNADAHWHICSVCGTLQKQYPHKMSAPVAVADGNEKRCECGYKLKEIAIDHSGVKVNAAYGVFADGIEVKAEKLTAGVEYGYALSALSDNAESIDVFEITARKGQLGVLPSGHIEVMLPVSKSYSGNVALYSVLEDGSLQKVNATIDRAAGTAKLSTGELGTFVVADHGTSRTTSGGISANTPNSGDVTSPKTGNNDILLIFIAVAATAGFIIITDKTYLLINKLTKENIEV